MRNTMNKITFYVLVMLYSVSCKAQSIAELQKGVSNGDPVAIYNLGLYYNIGKGIPKDQSQARSLFEKAASLGYSEAQYKLGTIYNTGSGVKKNVKKALIWFMAAAENGNVKAQCELGKYYTIQGDIAKSVYWYGQAAEQGSKVAKDVLSNPEYEKMYFSQKEPPSLEIIPQSIQFIDPSGNNAIKANGNYFLKFKVENTGKGNGYNCKVRLLATGSIQSVQYPSEKLISVLKKNNTTDVDIPITSGFDTQDGKISFTIQVEEPNGFGSAPQYLSVNTKAYEEPLLAVADYTLTNSAGNTTLKKKIPFDLQVLLQNIKQGKAEDVHVEISVPDNVVIVEGENRKTFTEIEGGETKSLVYSLIINNNYTAESVPIKVHLSEKYGRFAEDKVINLSLSQTFASNKIIIEEKQQNKKDILVASLSSDVDKKIPENKITQQSTFAVIIANENYAQVANVPYAINDGGIFKEYCQRTLGIPEENIHFVADATLGEFQHQIDWLRQVMEVYKEEAKVIFYYAGHGIPDESSKDAYLLPVDGYGNNTKSALSLDTFYKSLASLPSRAVVLFLDACFSGTNRNGDMLASARGVAIKAKQNQPTGNLVVFSASQGDETALPYNQQYHGMFTYFLLKNLQDTKGDATLGEMGEYITDNVRKQSVVTNGKMQTPVVSTSEALGDSWKNIKLK